MADLNKRVKPYPVPLLSCAHFAEVVVPDKADCILAIVPSPRREGQKMTNKVSQGTKRYYLTIEGQEVTVTEEVYRAYKRPVWAEHKRNDRQKLCQVSNGKGGLKRCTEDCSECKHTKEGSALSLEGLEDAGYSVEDHAKDVAEIVAEKMLLKELLIALEELDPDSHRICELFMEGYSKREIARLMSIPQSSFEYQFKKLMISLRERLEKHI